MTQSLPPCPDSPVTAVLSVKLSEREEGKKEEEEEKEEVRHYLLLQDQEEGEKDKKTAKVHLERSRHKFDNALALVFHYSRTTRYDSY